MASANWRCLTGIIIFLTGLSFEQLKQESIFMGGGDLAAKNTSYLDYLGYW